MNLEHRLNLRSSFQASDFSPILKSLAELLAIAISGQLMLFWVEVVSNRVKSRKKSLRLPWRFKSPHSSLSRSSWLMGILGSIVQSLVLPMLHVLHHLLLCGFVALKFVGDNHSRHKALPLQQFAEESMCHLCIPMPLYQNIEHGSVCIDRSPQIILLSLEHDHDFIEMPFIGGIRAFAPQLISVLLPKLLAPFSNRFIRHLNPTVLHYFFNVPVAQGKGVVET